MHYPRSTYSFDYLCFNLFINTLIIFIIGVAVNIVRIIKAELT